MDTNKKKHIDVELIVFDLDGTLVDSREDIAAAVSKGLQAVGGLPIPKKEIFPLIGQPLTQMFVTLLPDAMVDCAEQAAQAFRAYYFDHCADSTQVFPGVMTCLDRLTGLPLAVATTKMTFMAVQVIEKLGLSKRFALIQGSDGIPHKPNPTVIHQVLEKLDKPSDRCLMVGDTVFDIQAGKAAGLYTCAVSYGIGNQVDLAAQSPDLMLDNLSELPDYLS